MKDVEYYNKESSQYSEKRYPEVETQYVHLFFKRRLALLLAILARVVGTRQNMKLLEIGCADGFVLSAIAKKFKSFETLTGIDISPAMIEVARAHYSNDARTHYYVRDECEAESFDVIVEVGVLNLTDLREDLLFARDHLKDGGYYVCSLASFTSLISKLKSTDKEDHKHHLSFAEYERTLSEYFVIEKSIPYGLFIPHLWKVPALARYVQPAVEQVLSGITPSLFHEKIYLLRKR